MIKSTSYTFTGKVSNEPQHDRYGYFRIMIKYDEEANQAWITIPITGIHELSDYQNGVLGILKKIETDKDDEALKEDLKNFHRLLNYLLVDKGFFIQNEKLLLENLPPVILPPKVELAISLIKAELKNLKFVNGMHRQGVDASAGLWDFGVLILGLVGFDNNLSDELNEWYFKRQNELISDIEPGDDQGFSEAAFNFYIDLVVRTRGEASSPF